MALHVVVLAGGSGTRLWPLSRAAVPKHLLPLGPGGATLLRSTVERVLPLGADVSVVTVASQAEGCRDTLRGVDGAPVEVIAEPAARGTGPALGLAVRWIARRDPGAVVCSVHADHHVADDDAYREALVAAAAWAASTDGLATVGLRPTHPATGFGYVAVGPPRDPGTFRPPAPGLPAGLVEGARALPANTAAGFVEKPGLEVAEEYVAGGRHLWNTGLFAWPAAVFEREMRAASPDIDTTLGRVVEARGDGDEATASSLYATLPTVPVEPLVLERTGNLTVVQASFGWSDLGSWTDLLAARVAAGAADRAGNVVSGDAVTMGSSNCLVDSRGGRLVAVVGADGLVVVDTGDAVLVVPADRAQAVRDVVDLLRQQGRRHLL